ncbi:MAG TPA: transglycosylase domain-containing protein [Streptosporangiaceae bacterium]|nr:transglycosylase domain-containing protein [Streptosporangiaceae bacterium]
MRGHHAARAWRDRAWLNREATGMPVREPVSASGPAGAEGGVDRPSSWPRGGRPTRRPVRRGRRLLRRLAVVVAALLLLGIIAFAALLAVTPSAGNARELAQAQDRAHHAAYPGAPVPARFAASLVATEDHRFYSADVVYFGHGYYGLDAASCGYFGQRPADLSLAQAAMLAGLVLAPSADNPVDHPARARAREQHVLGRLAATHVLTSAQAAAAFAQPLQLAAARQASCANPR